MKPAMLVFCLLLLCTGSCARSGPVTVTETATGSAPPPPSQDATITHIPTSATLVCDDEAAAASLYVSTENVHAGDSLIVTITLKNEGCLALGLPQYRLSIQPDGSQPVFIPEVPDPVVHYLSVSPGESDSQTFELTAVDSGQALLTGSVSYEVHLGYPGPAYWSSAWTTPLTLDVAP